MSECDDATKRAFLDRLNRIEGQIRGIRKMMEERRGCFEVLKQVSAAAGAMRSLQKVILENHVASCLEEALSDDKDRASRIQELVKNLCSLS